MKHFALRCTKEILRDKLTLLFGIGFPVILLLLLSLIRANVPDMPGDMFAISYLTPGIAVFGLSFVSLFAGLLLAKDRSSSFLNRLFASPLRAWDFIGGYALPLFPMALAQTAVCYAVACVLGLTLSWRLLLAVLVTLPCALVFIALGLICGTLLHDKQVGGVCGALLTNLSAWLSGTWFDVALMGTVVEKIAFVLPFANAVEGGRAVLNGTGDVLGHLLIVCAWAIGLSVLAVFLFQRKMKKA